MTDYSAFLQNWTTITILNLMNLIFALIFVFLVIFLMSVLIRILFSNTPRKSIEKGCGGIVLTFENLFYSFYIPIVIYVIGGTILAPVLSFLRTLVTDHQYPIVYYVYGGFVLTMILYYSIYYQKHKRFINKDSYYFINNNIMILKFFREYGYIPLKFLKEIQVDKEHNMIRIIFKIRFLSKLGITPRWFFSFAEKDDLETLIHNDLREYNHLVIQKRLSKKRQRGIPLGPKTMYEIKQFELPTAILKIFI